METEVNTQNVSEAEEVSTEGSKIFRVGKYFLLFIVLIVQAYYAYSIIDKRYEEIYITIFGSLPDYSGIYDVGEFIVNPARTNGQRYLIVAISVELQHFQHAELIKQNEKKITDRFNEAISLRTVNDLMRLDVRENMRRELSTIINEVIEVDSVRNLYFTKYVLQ